MNEILGINLTKNASKANPLHNRVGGKMYTFIISAILSTVLNILTKKYSKAFFAKREFLTSEAEQFLEKAWDYLFCAFCILILFLYALKDFFELF